MGRALGADLVARRNLPSPNPSRRRGKRVGLGACEALNIDSAISGHAVRAAR